MPEIVLLYSLLHRALLYCGVFAARIQMRKSPVFITLFSIFLLGSARQVQAAPNFSGDWKMNIAKSDFGPVPAPEVLTRAIKHTDPALEIATHQKGARG